MKKIAVLLTVHNRKDKTIKCLRNLYGQLPIQGWNVDVFMTDDGCTDGTPKAVAQEFPHVHIITGDGNLYWNQGMRLAWNVASSTDDYDAYLWLNDDTMLMDDALAILLSSYAEMPDSIIAGTTKSQYADKITYGGYMNGKILVPNGELQRCTTFNGNIVLIPRSVYKKIGNLDPAYSHSIGDIDYGLSASRVGVKLYIAPRVIGYCENNPVSPKWMRSELPIRERWENLFSPLAYTNPREYYHFKRKHWGHTTAILAMFSIALHFISPQFWKIIKHRS